MAPEKPITVAIGDTVVVPLFDGTIGKPAGTFRLEDLGPVRVANQDLVSSLNLSPSQAHELRAQGFDAQSDRAEAFRAVSPGHGEIQVALRLPRVQQPCASCRVVHYFLSVVSKPKSAAVAAGIGPAGQRALIAIDNNSARVTH
jgi:hypothetical protein